MSCFWGLLCWRDLVEVTFFASLFYGVSCWLARDRANNLLPYFYGYCVAGLAAYFAGLQLIAAFLFFCAPAAAMIFILVHSQTLQRNFITHKREVQEAAPEGWVEALVSASLAAASDGKDVHAVVECTDAIAPFLFAQTTIGAPVDRSLLQVLFASPSYDASRMVWVASDGRLAAINVCHRQSILANPATVRCQGDAVCEWREDSALLSSKTDALFFRLDATNRRFVVVSGGVVCDDLEMTHALYEIKNHVQAVSAGEVKEGVSRGTTQTVRPKQQDLS